MTHREGVRILFLVISFTVIYGPVSLFSLLFVNKGNFSYFCCAEGLNLKVHYECFTTDISGLSASAFQSSCLIEAMVIVQQANCVDITNSLFFFCCLGLFTSLAFCRWGTFNRYPSHGQDLLHHHLSFYWRAEEQALTHPHRDPGLTCFSLTATPRSSHLVHVQQQGGAGGGRTGNGALLKLL